MKKESIKYVESDYRHKCLSDENIRYAVIKSTGTVHDKTCSMIKRLPDKELSFERIVNKDFRCDECKARASIRIGAKDGDIVAHEKFFSKVKAPSHQIVTMYVEKGFKTTLMNDILTIWYKDDVWKMRIFDKSGFVELKHNNYKRHYDNRREFVPGFHIQSGNVLFKHAVEYIYKYDYADHFKEEMCASEQSTDHNNEYYIEEPKQSIIGRIFSRIVFMYLKKYVFHNIYEKAPIPGKRSLIIYEGKDGHERIRAGAYCPNEKCFSISYAGKNDMVKLKKSDIELL